MEYDRFRLAQQTMAYVLAGGRGSRLKEMTDIRAKPAVYFGGKTRIIDFALSNAVNSGIRRIGVATQYKAHSLIRHLQRGWSFFRAERNEGLDILPASQQVDEENWYKGTADAVTQNISIIKGYEPKYILILAGDHIYKQDYSVMIEQHVKTGAKVTVGCIEVPRDEARAQALFERAATGGNMVAQYNLGLLLYRRGNADADRLAFARFTQAAQQGHIGAMRALVTLYSEGRGTERDDTAALGWMRKAEAAGCVSAKTDLAKAYQYGYGVPIDLPETRASALNSDTQPITISIRDNGEIYIQETAIPIDEVVPKLEAIAETGYDERIYIRGDQNADYGTIMQVMGRINQAGFKNLGLVTLQEQQDQ